MKDLREVVKSYDDNNVLLVTDYKLYIVANEILRTIRLLQSCKSAEDQGKFEFFVNEKFGLDINNNHLHMIMWENWMNFLADVDLIQIGTRWGNCTHDLLITDDDIKYLEFIINNEMV